MPVSAPFPFPLESVPQGVQVPVGDEAVVDVPSCVGEAELWVNLANAQLWDGDTKKRDLQKAEEAASR
jgi:hypothetical protein